MSNTNIGYVICESGITSKQSKIIGDHNGRVIIECCLQDMDVRNRNGRIYTKSEMIPEINGSRLSELLDKRSLFGEAGHPMSKDLTRQQTIDPKNISHEILKLWVDGNDVKGYVKGTPSSLGSDFNNYIIDGTIPAFSLRALGTIHNTAKGAEVKNLRIITWDWVIYPSHKKAYMEKIHTMQESASVICNENNLIKQDYEENDKGILIPITNDKIIRAIKNESANVYGLLESIDKLYDDVVLCNNGRQVRLSSNDGSIYVVNLESYVRNSIRNYASKLF